VGCGGGAGGDDDDDDVDDDDDDNDNSDLDMRTSPNPPSPPRITSHFQQLHDKSAGILLGDTSLADPPRNTLQSERGGGLVYRQQRAATAAETCTLRRRWVG